MHESVTTTLREHYGWQYDESPEPTAVDEYAAANPNDSEWAIADKLDSFLHDNWGGEEPPYGYAGTAIDYARRRYFLDGVKFWRENTNIALGVVEQPIVPQGRIAYNADDWWSNQDQNLSYLGYPLLDMSNPASADEALQRELAANSVPTDWWSAGLGHVYQVLTREGMLKKWVKPGFAPPAEYLGGDIKRFYGSNVTKILDNLHAVRVSRPPVWLDDQGWVKNPKSK